MNENINLVEILKDCPKGTKLYTPLAGEVAFCKVDETGYYPILVDHNKDCHLPKIQFTEDGRYYYSPNGECLLFPSKEQRDWSKFKTPWLKKPKFDPKTLQPFDKIMFKNENNKWNCSLISHVENIRIYLVTGGYVWDCIPYNEETKHLVGTSEEAPEYYRYWED